MSLKKLIKRIVMRERESSDSYILYLRNLGMEIGEDVTIYAPNKTVIDEQYPWMITIGNHVRITEGVKILTHDYSWSVLKRITEENASGVILGASGKVRIGDNVFIGMNTIILRNVSIGDNVIIGAGSIVVRGCEGGWVYAGNPAKKIMTVKEYYWKRKEVQLAEAKELAISYYKRYGKLPDKTVFHEYFMLFSRYDVPKEFSRKMELCGNYTDSQKYICTHKAKFSTYDEFLRYCFSDME